MAGRPKGALNKRPQMPKVLFTYAMAKLAVAVGAGESWAIQSVIDRWMPKLKPVTPEDSLDAEVLRARINELVEFDRRLAALESRNDK
ncbi:TPA: hypothetical protein ACXGA6_002530 [Klebsiella pneumoniae]